MSLILGLVAAASFGAGGVVGVAVAFATARRKFAAMNEAAAAAGQLISANSQQALADLAEAHARAETMIDAIENARLSTGRAKLSVTGLMSDIAASKAKFEAAAEEDWFEGALLSRLNRRNEESAEPAAHGTVYEAISVRR